uniref:Uncharacterized protein n=1 Tax=Candidatus Kentrum sp. UNK TaxID=2126344 RepID=A0A451AX85_9GAMM|nr:MAG: hypothetical protein BECKUNK1418G_GA0071005_102812 [Candidatus Kentron sp. UNK]VFK70660.1 MAG: hypothetical protein BECKUNK1418H_GA0071006_103512 [Candidatus Kentron sp. UNK]
MMPLWGKCRGQISDKRIHHHKLKIFVHYSPVIPLISGNPVTNISLIFLDRFVEDFPDNGLIGSQNFYFSDTFTMKQQPRFGAVGWIAPRIHHLLLPRWMRFAYPPYAGTFFIC